MYPKNLEIPKTRYPKINIESFRKKKGAIGGFSKNYLDSLRTLEKEDFFEEEIEKRSTPGKFEKEKNMMEVVLEQNMSKLDNEIEMKKELLKILKNQNSSLLMMKKKMKDFTESEQYQEMRLGEINDLIKLKIKKQKDLKLHKLDCFVKNVTEMIMINPSVLKDPQILFLIQNAKEETRKLEEVVDRKRKRFLNGNDSFSNSEELDFSDEEERKRYLKIKRERKALILKQKETEKLNQEKIKMMEEFNNRESFKIPEGMLLIAKRDYNEQLNEVKMTTEELMSEKFRELLKEELEKYDRIRQERKLLREKLKRVKKKLRGYYWAKVLPLILLKRTRMKFDERRQKVLQSYKDILPQVRDISYTIMKNTITKNCKEIWEEESSFNVIEDQALLFAYKEKPVSSKDIDKNIAVIEEYTRKILVGMIEIGSEEVLGKNLIDFLKSICFDGGYIPHNFLTQFELDRLEFDTNCKLINMNAGRRKMLIGFFLVFYILLNKVLTKPWRFDKSIQEDFKRRLFLRTVGSILFLFFMSYFKKNVEFIGDTQSHIKVEIRTTNRSPEQLFFDERAPRSDQNGEEDIFGDCFTKVQLKKVFFDKIAKFEKISVLIESFLDKIHDVLLRSYQDTMKVKNEEKLKKLIASKKNTIKFLKRIKISCKVKESFKKHLEQNS